MNDIINTAPEEQKVRNIERLLGRKESCFASSQNLICLLLPSMFALLSIFMVDHLYARVSLCNPYSRIFTALQARITKLIDIWDRGETFPRAMLSGFRQRITAPTNIGKLFPLRGFSLSTKEYRIGKECK